MTMSDKLLCLMYFDVNKDNSVRTTHLTMDHRAHQKKEIIKGRGRQLGLFSLNSVTEDIIKLLGNLSIPLLLLSHVSSR